MDIKNDLVEHVHVCTLDVFEKMLGWTANSHSGAVEGLPTAPVNGVTGSVSLVGKFCGVVYANFSEVLAEKVAEQILGANPPPDTAAVNDVVGELTNMISGNIKSKMSNSGFPCRLSIPTVIRGASMIDPGAVPITIERTYQFNGTEERATVHLYARFETDTL